MFQDPQQVLIIKAKTVLPPEDEKQSAELQEQKSKSFMQLELAELQSQIQSQPEHLLHEQELIQ